MLFSLSYLAKLRLYFFFSWILFPVLRYLDYKWCKTCPMSKELIITWQVLYKIHMIYHNWKVKEITKQYLNWKEKEIHKFGENFEGWKLLFAIISCMRLILISIFTVIPNEIRYVLSVNCGSFVHMCYWHSWNNQIDS